MRHRKDSCVNGHPYTPDNTYKTRSGARQCRRCGRDRHRRYRAERKAA